MSNSVKKLFKRLRDRFKRKKRRGAEESLPAVMRYAPQLIYDSGSNTIVMGVNNYADLSKVVIPGHVRRITQKAFRFNSKIEEVYISDGVREIEKYTFAYCKNLKKVRLPEGLEKVPFGCFYESIRLSEAELPRSLMVIWGDAFAKTDIRQAELPDSLIAVHDGAFNDCRQLSSVKFGKGLRRIGSKSFGSCHKLTEMVLPEGLEMIDSYAFTDCIGLRSVYIPDSIEFIGDNVFFGCNMLKELRLPLTPMLRKVPISMMGSVETLVLGSQPLDVRGIMPLINTTNQQAFLSMAAATIIGNSRVLERYGYEVGLELAFRTQIRLLLGGCRHAAELLKNADKSILTDRQKEESAMLTERFLGKYGESLDRQKLEDLMDIAVKLEAHEAYVILVQYRRDRFGFDSDDSDDGSMVGGRFNL